MVSEASRLPEGYQLFIQTTSALVCPVSLRDSVPPPSSSGVGIRRLPSNLDTEDYSETIGAYPRKGLDVRAQLADNVVMSVQQFCDLVNSDRPHGWAILSEETEKAALDWLAEYLSGQTIAFGIPHMSISAHGEFVFTWWRGSRKLSVYCDDSGAEYLKTWGPDIDTEMESGPAIDIDRLFAWLRSTGANAA